MSNIASKILVPIGFSNQSIVALEQLLNLAKIKNSEVVLLTVIEEKHSILDILIDNDIKEDKIKEKLLTKINDLADNYFQKYDVKIETMIARGSVYEKVCEVADMISADLIVMGTNGSPQGIAKKFIGL